MQESSVKSENGKEARGVSYWALKGKKLQEDMVKETAKDKRKCASNNVTRIRNYSHLISTPEDNGKDLEIEKSQRLQNSFVVVGSNEDSVSERDGMHANDRVLSRFKVHEAENENTSDNNNTNRAIINKFERLKEVNKSVNTPDTIKKTSRLDRFKEDIGATTNSKNNVNKLEKANKARVDHFTKPLTSNVSNKTCVESVELETPSRTYEETTLDVCSKSSRVQTVSDTSSVSYVEKTPDTYNEVDNELVKSEVINNNPVKTDNVVYNNQNKQECDSNPSHYKTQEVLSNHRNSEIQESGINSDLNDSSNNSNTGLNTSKILDTMESFKQAQEINNIEPDLLISITNRVNKGKGVTGGIGSNSQGNEPVVNLLNLSRESAELRKDMKYALAYVPIDIINVVSDIITANAEDEITIGGKKYVIIEKPNQ